MRNRIRLATPSHLVLASVMLACSSPASAVPNNAVDGGSDAGGPAGALRVLVLDVDNSSFTLNTPPPLANAAIAVDLPGGEHRELTAGPDGRATITGIDWSLGTATVLTYRANHAVYGVTDVGPNTFATMHSAFAPSSGQDVVLYSFPLSDPKLSVGGMLTNKKDPNDAVLVSGVRCPVPFEATTSTYSLGCSSGNAFDLVGREESISSVSGVTVTTIKWFESTVPAMADGSTTVNIDMNSVTPLAKAGAAKVHLELPANAATLLPNATSLATISSYEYGFNIVLGSLTSLVGSPSGFDYGLEWVAVPGQTPISNYFLLGSDGSFSRLIRSGVPTDGQKLTNFILPPTPKKSLSLRAPVPIDGSAPSAVVRIYITSDKSSYDFILDAPPGTTSVDPPPSLPTAAKPPAGTLSGAIMFMQDMDMNYGFYTTVSGTSALPATLP